VEYLDYRLRQGSGSAGSPTGQWFGRLTNRAEGKEEGCKAKGNNDCLGGHDITSEKYLHQIKDYDVGFSPD